MAGLKKRKKLVLQMTGEQYFKIKQYVDVCGFGDGKTFYLLADPRIKERTITVVLLNEKEGDKIYALLDKIKVTRLKKVKV